MFGKNKNTRGSNEHKGGNGPRGAMTYDIPVFFGIIFALSIAEMCFTVDAFIILEREHKWWSGTEKARLAFLAFSSARAIFLSSLYIGFHCCHVKNLMNTMHVIFLVISTILWVVSGVLIHQMWGYVECENAGVVSSVSEFKSQIQGGLTLCHEIKIIEILAWVIAGVSVLATIPVVMTWFKNMKAKRERQGGGGAGGHRKTATNA